MDRKVRRSQCIIPFGVGAILDIGQESFIAEDISKWGKKGEKIELKRLSNRLGIQEFRMPPVPKEYSQYPDKIPFRRFPEWLFCSSCDDLQHWTTNKPQHESPKCDNKGCNGNKLTSMRFVMACENGHLSDVDWHSWAHSGNNIAESGRCDIKNKLKYRSRKNNFSGGLDSLEIYCEACHSSRSLEGITMKGAVKSMKASKCQNKQPWEFLPQDQFGKCEETPLVVQKGASNLYFPKVISALDIPLNGKKNQTEAGEQILRPMGEFEELKEAIEGNDQAGQDYLARKCHDKTGLSIEDILRVANEDLSKIVDDDEQQHKIAIKENEILIEEWPVIISSTGNEGINFKSYEESFDGLDNYGLKDLFEKLILIPRLREVRALRGFNRIVPKEKDFVSAGLDFEKRWLPAVEVFGEGIFIQFSEEAILNWSNSNKKFIEKRIGNINKQYKSKELDFLTSPPSARFILLHTFSHLLIRQLAFECGYSESSLRERIYASDGDDDESPMAGILIYTADSDSEGALGGLVRQGKKDRFIATVMMALERGCWCSGDPVCRELDGQGMMGLNRAACHACALISETSCVSHNIFLDRILAIGDEKNPFGFFSDAVKKFRT